MNILHLSIVVLVFVVLLLLSIFAYINRNEKSTRRNLPDTVILLSNMPVNECNKLIYVGDKFGYETDLDPVDNEPTYETSITNMSIATPNNERGVFNVLMDSISEKWRKTFDKYLPKDIKGTFPTSTFFKRYTVNERVDIPPHRDDCAYAVVVQVSSPVEVTGGEFYIYPIGSKQGESLTRLFPNQRREVLKNSKSIPIVHLKQGEVVLYKGDRHIHGVLPVTKGIRHALIYFYGGYEKRLPGYKPYDYKSARGY